MHGNCNKSIYSYLLMWLCPSSPSSCLLYVWSEVAIVIHNMKFSFSALEIPLLKYLHAVQFNPRCANYDTQCCIYNITLAYEVPTLV